MGNLLGKKRNQQIQNAPLLNIPKIIDWKVQEYIYQNLVNDLHGQVALQLQDHIFRQLKEELKHG